MRRLPKQSSSRGEKVRQFEGGALRNIRKIDKDNSIELELFPQCDYFLSNRNYPKK